MTPGTGLGGGHPGDSHLVILDAWSRRESPWILWMCDYRFRLWGYPGLWIYTPSCSVLGVESPGDCGHVIPGTVSVEGCQPRHWKCDPRSRVERVHRGYCGHVTPGAGSRRWSLPGDCTHVPQYRFWEVGSLGDCGHVTQSAVSREEADPGDCGLMTICI